MGNTCRKRHFYQEADRTAILPTCSSGVTARAPELVEFSSPLVVKVRKEVAKERREELDLETGTRRSWVESREFDVLDLTGWISCIPRFIKRFDSSLHYFLSL